MKIMKKLSLLLTVVMLICSLGLNALASNNTVAGYVDYLGKKTIVNCEEFVTLRASASTSASPVTRVAKGEVVDAYYYSDTFSRCFYNGMEGYILNDYLGSGAVRCDGCSSSSMGYIANCSEWVSLRASASTSSARLCQVPLGAIVEIYSYSGQFAYCYYDGMWGYILSDYIRSAGYSNDFAYVVNCSQWVSLRSYASTSSARLCQVPLGAIVEIYNYNGQFSSCCYDGMWGYILNDYLMYCD